MKTTLTFITLIALMTSAHAATTGNLLLQGNVAQELSLVVNPVAGVHDDLDLSITASDLLVASVDESSNSNSGYKISVSSANGGFLKNGALDQLAYTMKYAGSSVTLSTTAQVAKTVATAGVFNESSNVEISYTGKPASQMVQGTYSDTVTFEIAAN